MRFCVCVFMYIYICIYTYVYIHIAHITTKMWTYVVEGMHPKCIVCLLLIVKEESLLLTNLPSYVRGQGHSYCMHEEVHLPFRRDGFNVRLE